MEIKINKEIRDYTESVYFGLSLRQFIFSIIACLVAIILYFILKPFFNIETLSWICILGSVPFALIGFVKYNGMTAEEFIFAYIQSEIITPRHLTFESSNYYYELIKNKGDDKNKNNKKSI